MELIEPSLAYIESYKSALVEFEEHGISGFWCLFGPIDDPAKYLHEIGRYRHRSGTPVNLVPASVFWLVDGPDFIGHVSIRHELNAALENYGGHIGYAIRPSKQRQGYGTRILELAIPKAKALGIERALLTCDKTNAASRRIIEKNGGLLMDEIHECDRETLRFWIAI
jgi:predicted acetyltransferase